MIRAALYLRATDQPQEAQLREIARARDWTIAHVFADIGIAGERPGLAAMLSAASKHRFSIVTAWAMDTMGRSLTDLLYTMGHLADCSVDLYLHQEAVDTTTKEGRAIFKAAAALANFERSMIVGRIQTGIERAKAEGRPLGRPRIGEEKEAIIRKAIRQRIAATGRAGICAIAKQHHVGVSAVQRVKREMGI